MKKLKYIFLGLVLADMILTIWGMYLGQRENHPLVRYMFENYSYFGIIITFGIFAFAYNFVTNGISKDGSEFGILWWGRLTKFGIIIRSLVVLTNCLMVIVIYSA